MVFFQRRSPALDNAWESHRGPDAFVDYKEAESADIALRSSADARGCAWPMADVAPCYVLAAGGGDKDLSFQEFASFLKCRAKDTSRECLDWICGTRGHVG